MVTGLWIITRGYIGFAIEGNSLRKAIRTTLQIKKFSFEERTSSFYIFEEHARIIVETQKTIGLAQIRFINVSNRETSRIIINGINNFYKSNPRQVSYVTPIVSLCIAIAYTYAFFQR